MRYIILFILIIFPQYVIANCREYIFDNTAGNFEYSYDCENKFGAINYKLIRSYTNTLDFEFFKIGVDTSTLICTKLTNEDEKLLNNPCRRYGFPVAEYSEKIGDTEINFKQYHLLEALRIDFETLLADKDIEFIYPEDMTEFDVDQCVATFDSGEIYLYSFENSVETFSECVFQLEQFFTNR